MERKYVISPPLNPKIWREPDLYSDAKEVSFYNYKKDECINVKLPSWLSGAIKEIKEEAYKEGYKKARQEIKSVLGIRE